MDPCPGPMIWFAALDGEGEETGAVLECVACDYVIATGSFHDAAHCETPILREGLAS